MVPRLTHAAHAAALAALAKLHQESVPMLQAHAQHLPQAHHLLRLAVVVAWARSAQLAEVAWLLGAMLSLVLLSYQVH